MKPSMKTSMATLTLLAGLACQLHGQATPTASRGEPTYNPGPSLPLIDGNFKYSLTLSELVYRGVTIGNYTQTAGSGTVEYLSKSAVTPFSLLYTGGLEYTTYGSLGFQTFQLMSVSQGLVAGAWNLGVSDSVSYLPQSPSGGLGGVPGLGNQGVLPTPNPNAPAQLILGYGKQLSNTVDGDIQRRLNARTTLTGSANYGILRYIDGSGYDTSQIGSQIGINRKLNARTIIGLDAQYGVFSFVGGTTFTSRGINVDFNRVVSRSLAVQASIGPQWVSSFSGTAVGGPTPTQVSIPARLNLAANVSAAYTHRFTNASLLYSRGVNNGSGVQTGAISDVISAQLQQAFGRDWSAAASATYMRTAGLAIAGTTFGIYGSTQVTRRLGRDFSTYASFTAQYQNLSSALSGSYLLNGTTKIYSIGITYAPGSTRLGQF